MPGEEAGAKSVGWTDCGTDPEGKQVLVNLLGLRHIEVERDIDDPEAELVILYYGGVEEATELNAHHSKQFLQAAGLRKPTSELILVPDLAGKIPMA